MGRGIGLDIGAEAVKVVEVQARPRAVEVLGAASFRRASLGVEGTDPDALARAAAARAAELGFRGGPAVAGIAGKDVMLRYLNVPPAPVWKLRQLLDYEVGEITGEDPRDFAHDFRPLNLPRRGTDEFLLLVAVARNQVLEERLAAFAAGGRPVECLSPEATALFNGFAPCVEAEPEAFVCLLDVGARQTQVVFARNQALVFARSVLPGGREFTEAIAETLDVSESRAEEIKRRRGAVLPGAEIAGHTGHEAEFYEALAAVAEQLVRAVQSTVMFARTQTRLTRMEVSRYVLSGGGARLEGLRERLAKGLGRPVEWLDLTAGAAGAESIAEPPTPYAAALG
ncbi:MAG: pilus assembly protein PilM, partial [Planctomycetota bacterium]